MVCDIEFGAQAWMRAPVGELGGGVVDGGSGVELNHRPHAYQRAL